METRSKATDWKREASGVFEKRWCAYAVAGAGALVLAPQAHATIHFTPSNSTITATCSGGACTSGEQLSGTLSIDLTGSDGGFGLQAGTSSSAAILHFLAGATTNLAGALRTGGIGGTTPMFTAGQSIGPGGGFSVVTGAHLINPSATWKSGDGFLGLQFHLATDPSGGDVNFGWAELNRTFVVGGGTDTYTVTLKGFAYEDTPNVKINAGDTGQASGVPEPGTAGLALLAMGACGVAAWRKRKQAQTA